MEDEIKPKTHSIWLEKGGKNFHIEVIDGKYFVGGDLSLEDAIRVAGKSMGNNDVVQALVTLMAVAATYDPTCENDIIHRASKTLSS